jgi:hypothetical protein
MREGFRGKTTWCRNAEGEVLTDGYGVINRWNISRICIKIQKLWKGYLNGYQRDNPMERRIDNQQQKKSYKQLQS